MPQETNEANDNNVSVPLTGQEIKVSGATILEVRDAAAFAKSLPRELRTSPKLFAYAATDFLEGFKRLPSGDAPELPRLVLAGLCLECLLKAYIGQVDTARLKAFVRGSDGHDIKALWEEAAKASAATTGKKLSIGAALPWWCSTVAAFHSAPYLNRYPVGVSITYAMPNHEELSTRLQDLLAEVRAALT